MTKRSVPEWIGKTPDSAIPPRVKLRVFEAHGGVCYLTDRKIMPGDDWDAEHKLAICNGGENREGNLAPALRTAHHKKTRADVKIKAKNERVRKKYLGIFEAKRPIPGSKNTPFKRKIGGTTVRRDDNV